MKKESHIIISFIIMLICLVACEESILLEYKTIYGGDKIVVHGFISQQDGVNVIVKKTVPPDGVTTNDIIENADVELFENNHKLFSLIRKDDYLYHAPDTFMPKMGAAYHLEISSPGMPKAITSVQLIFAPTPLDSVKLFVEDLTYFSNIVAYFNHSQNSEKAYYLNVTHYHNGSIDSADLWWNSKNLFSFAGLIDNINDGPNAIEHSVNKMYEFDSILVKFFTLSPDLKKFLKTYKDYDSSCEDPYFETVYPVYSNVTNGNGIFASYSYYPIFVRKDNIVTIIHEE